MNCPHCGSEYVEGKFCNVCGADLEVTAEETVLPTDDSVIEQPTEVAETVSTENPGKVFGIISLALGIVSVLLSTICSCLFSCLGGILPCILAIAGLALGFVGLSKSKAAGHKNILALIGMILSGVSIGIVLLFTIFNAILGGIIGAASSSNNFYY